MQLDHTRLYGFKILTPAAWNAVTGSSTDGSVCPQLGNKVGTKSDDISGMVANHLGSKVGITKPR